VIAVNLKKPRKILTFRFQGICFFEYRKNASAKPVNIDTMTQIKEISKEYQELFIF